MLSDKQYYKINSLLNLIIMLELPMIIMICVEWVQRKNFGIVLLWVKGHVIEALLTYLLILIFFVLIQVVFNRFYVSMFITSVIFIGLSIINWYKIILRGDPLTPSDFAINKEAVNILEHFSLKTDSVIVLVLILIIWFTLVCFYIKTKIYRLKHRIISAVLIVSVGFILFKNIYLNENGLERLSIQTFQWNQSSSYERNGFSLSFILNMKNVIVKQPNNYDEFNVLNQFKSTKVDAKAKSNSNIKPNIIMIMSEAFWDPTQIKNVKFSEELLPNVNYIRNNGVSGQLLSSIFGGNTAQTEFEVLTGNSTSFLPSGSIAYNYINSPLPSMATYLKQQGYDTIAIHPYEKWFYKRDIVYPNLGFDKFVSINDFKNPETKRSYISDMETVKEVIKRYEHHGRDSFFAHIVTMQNHGPYDVGYDNPVKIVGSNLSSTDERILETYATGVRDADAALGYLVNYFKSKKEPTIIVMYGDHEPMLGENYSVYRNTGYISTGDLSLDDKKNLHTIPLVVWSNYKLEHYDIGTISANYLGAYVMEYADLKLPLYFQFINKLRQDIPAYIPGLDVDKNNILRDYLTETQYSKYEQYWLLQYDLMFGKGYGKSELTVIK